MPIYGLVALGLGRPDRIRRNSTARAGDVLILGKPLGVGVFSAALKKGLLSPDDYATMIASTTKLNRPGTDLSRLDGVSAMTDVTGFGLLGHLAEMCRGAGLCARIDRAAVPVFPGARRLVAEGIKTGASGRNWASVSPMIAAALSEAERDIFCDPQTSGGLLIACAPGAVDDALAAFGRHGHEAAVIGKMAPGPARIIL